jgi:hypothetical protein
MSRKAAMTLAVLFTFISASAVLAEANNRTDYPVPDLAQSALFRRGTTSETIVWIN